MTTYADAQVLLSDLSLDDLRILRQHLPTRRVGCRTGGVCSRPVSTCSTMWTTSTPRICAMCCGTRTVPHAGGRPSDCTRRTSTPRCRRLGHCGAAWSISTTTDQRTAYIDMLQAMEGALSTNRRALHKQIDAVTAELIARYRTNPRLALTALPRRSSKVTQRRARPEISAPD